MGEGSSLALGRGGMGGILGRLVGLNEEWRRISSRARLRDGVRMGVKAGWSLLDAGGDWKGYSVAPEG